ncbi:GTP diphosphokinase [Pseudomonadota bacterium]
MTQSLEQPSRSSTHQELVDKWTETMSTERDRQSLSGIVNVVSYAEGKYLEMQPELAERSMAHLLAVASSLDGLQVDCETIVASVLHGVRAELDLGLDVIEKQFGKAVAILVEGVGRMDVIQEYSDHGVHQEVHELRTENLRKMLLAMVDDVRVVLIKLAERLELMRSLKQVSNDIRRFIARETLDIFSPLANRLGIWQYKWELEDLSLRYLEPDAYSRIAGQLAERRVDREKFIKSFVELLQKELQNSGIQATISGRPKHIYSIWKKMKRKDLEFEHIFDVRAVRILVDDTPSCYTALGVVHTLWSHIAGEFDDYIATPKENNYQSIHTAVIGPKGNVVEVQIRSKEMHQDSELGIAAHWRYKESAKKSEGLDRKVLWLRQLLEWKEEVAHADDIVKQFQSDAFEDRVYVFTPKGNVIDLPEGATPLDFAYAIHTEVGHRCRGAKVNRRIVPLTYALKTGEQVEVLTVKKGGPSRDWVNPHLGYLHTSKARARVLRWFKEENYEDNISSGRNALEKELQRLGLSDVKFEKLAGGLDFKKVDDFLAAIGSGDLKISQAVSGLRNRIEPGSKDLAAGEWAARRQRKDSHDSFTIQGVGNLLTQMGRCCNPLPGDLIVGYITQNRGVTIHRQDCANALNMITRHRERLVEVDWGVEQDTAYPVELQILAYDRSYLLHDISAVLSDAGINVIGVNTRSDKKENIAYISMTVEVSDIQKLSKVVNQIAQVANVTDVRRVTQ